MLRLYLGRKHQAVDLNGGGAEASHAYSGLSTGRHRLSQAHEWIAFSGNVLTYFGAPIVLG